MVTVRCTTRYAHVSGVDNEVAYIEYAFRCKRSLWAEQWNKLLEDAKKLWRKNPRKAVAVTLKAFDDDGLVMRTWTTARKSDGNWEVIR